MRSIGIPRKVDDLGRIVLPVEFRRVLGIREGDELEVTLDGDRLTLRRLDPCCAVCGAIADLRPVRARHLCGPCAAEAGGFPPG